MIVTKIDGKKMRVRARIVDEDDTQTYWLDITGKSSSSNKSYDMPDMNDEVWALVDPKGEEGVVMGSRYNDKDVAPTDNSDERVEKGPWGSMVLDKTTGNLHITLNGDLNITVDNIVINGQKITHNDRNIGHDHTHGGIVPGGADTDIPNP